MRKLILEIEKYIRELLFDYDCVIVPQLGGFVTNYRPAHIDADSGIASPPGKDILFNKNLTQSDGLLEKALASGSEISFEEAGISLKKLTEEYWSKLNGGEKVNFKRIGVLYIDEHKKLRFEPSADQNYLKTSFGLDSFSLPPKLETEINTASENTTGEAEVEEIPLYEDQKFRKSKSIYWVAAATLTPFLAMSIYLGLSTNFKSPMELTTADLNPFKTATSALPTYEPREATTTDMAIKEDKKESGFPDNTTVFPFSFDKNEVDSTGVWVNLEKDAPKVAKAAVAKIQVGQYHIIAGCFGEKSNAEKFVSRLKGHGYNASILDLHKNLHRVQLESFNDYSTALNELQDMRTDGTFPNAWLLKKPKS